jgi:hypothetical protein
MGNAVCIEREREGKGGKGFGTTVRPVDLTAALREQDVNLSIRVTAYLGNNEAGQCRRSSGSDCRGEEERRWKGATKPLSNFNEDAKRGDAVACEAQLHRKAWKMRVIIIVYRSNPFQCFIFVRFQLASLLFPLCRPPFCIQP